MNKTAVIFGAGNIGRGFIGQLFCESGYTVTFVDVDEPLLDKFNQEGAYRLQTVYNNDTHDYTISPVRAIHAGDIETVAQSVADAEIAATSVGARVLPHVAPNLARGIEIRAKKGRPPLDIILCENLKGAAQIVRQMVEDEIDDAAADYLAARIGFVDTVIGRMVPPPSPESRKMDPSFIRVEPYKELPVDKAGFKGEVPEIVGMEAHDNFKVFTARKLYIHNCGHALLAYKGWLRGFEYGYQALEDAQIRKFIFDGWEESIGGIVHQHKADASWLREHTEDLYQRFQNRALGDTIFRLGRDPVRKLAPTDRLVAPAKLASQTGNVPRTLCAGIAAAFCFAPDDDPIAQQLQADLVTDGLQATLQRITGINPDSRLGKAITDEYAVLRQC